jgi:hypothetical protein
MFTTVTRRYKHEAEMAIDDLEKRGFKVVYPLTELSREGKRFSSDEYNRKVFLENTYSSCWIARLERKET